ncbi:MAG: glycosyltransferase family 2 protein [Betaproteobacteria bacterium]|nr:glycosyltransferase family 2 protein [Betaproteobacteria bacterium]
MPGTNIVGVIVTFRPEGPVLQRLLEALLKQVAHVVIADNGSEGVLDEVLKAFPPGAVSVLPMGGNLGIATGLNRGVAAALAMGATHLLLSDQDSLPAPDMVASLLKVCQAQQEMGVRVAAVGPRYLDDRADNPPPFIRVDGLQLRRLRCDSASAVVPVDYLITSGSLIPAEAWAAIGGMEEKLFIDYVDIEWGMRAMAQGYRCFGACGARMGHSLGDEPIRFFGKVVPVHSPLRHYYHFRNAVWLYRQPWVQWNWKVVDGARLVLKFGFYSLITAPRFQHFRSMVRGVWHGLLGTMGRLDA